MANPNSWDPVSGLYYDQSGNQVSEDDFYRQRTQQNMQSLGAQMLTPAEQQQLNTQGSAGLTPPHPNWGLYNTGNGMAWAPQGDARFMPAPQHNDSFLSTWTPGNDATPEMHGGALVAFGGPLIGAAGTAIAAGAGAGAGGGLAGDAALAGGGEVGSGYAASAPGWGAGEIGGTAGSGTLTGSTANDTLGGNTMFDDYGNPLDMGGSGSNTWTGADESLGGKVNYGDPNATGAFDQFGNANPNGTNPTGDYSSPSMGLQDYLNYLKQGQSALSGYGSVTSLLGKLLQTGLGVKGSQAQQQGFQNQANQYMDMGAPYRARLAQMYNDPSSFFSSPQVTVPVQQGTDILAHSLSAGGGNPVGSGNTLQQLQSYATGQLFGQFGNEANRLANFGGLSQFNAAAPGASTNAIGSGSNVYNALGAGASDIFNPQPSLAQTMAEYKRLSSAIPVA